MPLAQAGDGADLSRMFRDSLDRLASRRTVLAAAWLLAVVGVATQAFHYWIPLDDGTLAHSAQRVLSGQLPHRDFGDPYTGLNAMVGALAFRIFGVTLSSLRIPLVAGFALWLPALFLLMRRLAGPASSVVLTAVAATASVLNYPAAMPTWFGLFLVTWGLVALLQFLDHGQRRWLAACGAAAGGAMLFKIVGLYFLAACLLALAMHRPLKGAYLALSAGALALFLILLGELVLPTSGAAGAYHFFVPAVVLVVLVLTAGGRRGTPGDLIRDVAALLGGFLAPLALFVVPYVATGGTMGTARASVGDLIRGVLFLPTQRLVSAASAPPPLWTALPALVAVVMLEAVRRAGPTRSARLTWGLVATLALALALDDVFGGRVVTTIWWTARGWVPALVLWGAWVLSRREGAPSRASERTRNASFAVLATAALWSLVQFPYTAPAYFFYVAPLLVPATAMVVQRAGPGPRRLAGVYAALLFLLSAGYSVGVARSANTPLGLDRGDIRVAASDAALYGSLVPLVRAHARGGPILATPDLPEVYFLTGLTNPSRVLYEFLEPAAATEQTRLHEMDTGGIDVVVLNRHPIFSAAPSHDYLEGVRARYPHGKRLGQLEVRWRDGAPDSTLAGPSNPGASTR